MRILDDLLQALLQHKAKVYMASRNRAKAEEAIQELKAVTGREAIFLEINLDSIASVRKAAAEFLRSTSTIFAFSVSEGFFPDKCLLVARKLSYIYYSTMGEPGGTCSITSFPTLCRGVMWPAPEKVSSEGFDYQFATNAVGTFPFTPPPARYTSHSLIHSIQATSFKQSSSSLPSLQAQKPPQMATPESLPHLPLQLSFTPSIGIR